MSLQHIENLVQKASGILGNTWPLYSFVTSNPLRGYENMPFIDAVDSVKETMGAKVFPDASMYQHALQSGGIDKAELSQCLQEHGYGESPQYYLELLKAHKPVEAKNQHHDLDRIMVKWLSAFLDEGLAEWEMPFKRHGFFKAWRSLAPYDQNMGGVKLNRIPKTSDEALTSVLSDFPEEQHLDIFVQHLAALPGWSGYINHRNEQDSSWQQKYPVDLKAYLAVRLWTARKLGLQILDTKQNSGSDPEITELQYLWLKAWEKSWQNQLVQTLEDASAESPEKKEAALEAQMVFCIDTRSELIRRHVEAHGPYETFGYAGFFGIAMDYQSPKNGHIHKACPPILPSSYTVSEAAAANQEEAKQALDRKNGLQKFQNYFLKRMKNMLPSSFGFVEGSGLFYGLNLVSRTIIPAPMYRYINRNDSATESVCEPQLNQAHSHETSQLGISKEEEAGIVKSAFQLMGWKEFAPLVVFTGHGSHSANNPFGSSLDCGACAASPGRHNARMIAKLANDAEVKRILAEAYDIHIPENTFFLGAEHNTTTDAIVLFDAAVPASHKDRVTVLKHNLAKAQETATRERLGVDKNSIAQAEINAYNWGETRPEWGLAKNASFIIAPRTTTQNHDLDGRCFLHSYDWEMDSEGAALEAIMQGPMVVTQWINNHYYFSTVDNDQFGGGTKTTHNVTGKFGVVQGNGGDLKIGLPWESLYQSDDEPYHLPLRLSVVIQAPLSRVQNIIDANDHLKTLVENEWLYLMVMDPENDMTTVIYQKENGWLRQDGEQEAVTFQGTAVNEPAMAF